MKTRIKELVITMLARRLQQTFEQGDKHDYSHDQDMV